jgi:cytosine/adenosine deaminase-related metal-dependent hydrolase
MNADKTTALRGRYVFPVVGDPIENGVVTLRGDTIVAVGKPADVEPIEMGNVSILPGLVNAHTHLEFSLLERPLGEAGEPLPTWIRRVIAARTKEPDLTRLAIARGIEQSMSAGVTAIGEISTSLFDHAESPTMTIFHEVICLDKSRFDATFQQLERYRQRSLTTSGITGLSPHAPYSVHPQLLGPLCDFAKRNQWPVAMHLAESPEEMELLGTGRGPFRELLQKLGVWQDDANPKGLRPLNYLQLLTAAPRALVVHGNYLDAEEHAFVAERRERMGIVYCPRTHAYFGHAPYPLERLWSSGVTVCIGTDSRASNPDLNLLDELKFAAASHPAVPLREILRMGTVNGARMLSGSDAFGALETGRRANLAIVSLPDRNAADPHELIFSDEAEAGAWTGHPSAKA